MSFPYPPIRSPLNGPDGLISRDWVKWFQALGNAISPPVNPFLVQPSATPNFDWSQSLVQEMTLVANANVTFLNPQFGPMILILTQNTTGGFTVTWPSNAYNATQPGVGAGTSTVYIWLWSGSRFLICGTPVAGQ